MRMKKGLRHSEFFDLEDLEYVVNLCKAELKKCE